MNTNQLLTEAIEARDAEQFEKLIREMAEKQGNSKFLEQPIPERIIEDAIDNVTQTFDWDNAIDIRHPYSFFKTAIRNQLRFARA